MQFVNSVQPAFAASSLSYLSTKYPPTLNVEQLAEITSESPQTIRNRLTLGTYHVPSFKVGRKRVFRLIDVAQFLDQRLFDDPSYPSHCRPKRGRPTKVERAMREQHRVVVAASRPSVDAQG